MAMTLKKPVNELTVITLCGGPSAESEVSLKSGRAVHEALVRTGINSTLVELSGSDLSFLGSSGVDIVFNALHGQWGEDGGLQEELDLMGIPYTGSRALACDQAFDKLKSKELFQKNRIPTPAWWALKSTMHVNSILGLSCIEFPAVSKPVRGGSSQGVTIVRRGDDLADAVVKAGRYDEDVLVERYIEGREFTVGMLGGEALPVIELRSKRAFYDYEAKYNDNDTEYLCPAELPALLTKRLQKYALAACQAVGAEHFSRVDILMDKEELPFVLEVNIIPGFTDHSLLPKAALAAGISFSQLCRKIVELGWERHHRPVSVEKISVLR